jgi:hypothetical protein
MKLKENYVFNRAQHEGIQRLVLGVPEKDGQHANTKTSLPLDTERNKRQSVIFRERHRKLKPEP